MKVNVPKLVGMLVKTHVQTIVLLNAQQTVDQAAQTVVRTAVQDAIHHVMDHAEV